MKSELKRLARGHNLSLPFCLSGDFMENATGFERKHNIVMEGRDIGTKVFPMRN